MSKTEKLLKCLKRGGKVTPAIAWKRWGLYRLADAVYKLKNRGYRIKMTLVVLKNGDSYGKYSMK